MISISDKNLNLVDIKNNFYKQRINNEIDYLNTLEKTDENEENVKHSPHLASLDEKRKAYLLSVLCSYENKTEIKKEETFNQDLNSISEKEFKKSWVRMAIPHKIIKIEEYCKEKGIDEETKNKYIQMAQEKKLKTKNVQYDNKICKIIKIEVN